VVSVAYDRLTGRLYEGVNTVVDDIPDDLHPVLQARLNSILDEASANPGGYDHRRTGSDPERFGDWPHPDDPGTHAEVYAVNRALRDREAMGHEVTEETLREIVVDNRWLTGGRAESPAPCCANCTIILGGPENGVDVYAGMRETFGLGRR
jgi:hypothetical protein